MTDTSLKPGWRKWRFDQIATNVNERIDNPSESDFEYYVGLEHIDPNSLKLRRWGSPSDVEATKLIFRKGDIIFGRRRVYQRKVAVAEFDGICSAHALVLRANSEVVLPDFLPFFIQSDLFMERAQSISVGSLSPTINWKTLAKEEFILPSLEEQKTLARALVAAQLSVETVSDCLTSQNKLFQSYIDSQVEHFICKGNVSIGDLVLQGIISPPQDGNHGGQHPKGSDYVDDGIPFLMASDISEGCVNLSSCKFISLELAKSLRIGFAQEGDVLLTHKGTLGETAILRGLRTEFAMLTPQVTDYHILKKEKLIPDFLYLVFRSSFFQRQLASHGRQSTRAYVGIKNQRNLLLPLPSLGEQEKAVAGLLTLEKTAESLNTRKKLSEPLKRLLVDKLTEGKINV